MRLAAIVLARGGSQRIPRKNARPFRGRPLIAWPTTAARDWGRFEKVWVSTDCPDIEALAMGLGAESLGLRSSEAASHTASTNQALKECLERLAERGPLPDAVCCLYGSAAFVTPVHLQAALDTLVAGPFDLVFPVLRFGYPIWRALARDEAGQTGFVWPEHALTRSQDLPAAFHDAGQFYLFRPQVLLQTGALTGGRTGSIELPETHCHDIDNLVDWEMAEIKHARLTAGQEG